MPAALDESFAFSLGSPRDWPGGPSYSAWFAVGHAIAMFLGWAVFATLGLLASSFWRSNSAWFVVHVVANVATLILTVAGMVLISAYFEWHFFPLTHSHHWLGFFLLLLACLQSILGLVAHLRYNPNRRHAPFFPDRLHGHLGRISFVMGLVQCFTGFPLLFSDLDKDVARAYQWTQGVWYGVFAVIVGVFWTLSHESKTTSQYSLQ